MSQTLSNFVRDGDRVRPRASLQVEVIADFVCPFCFIGKRRLDEALEAVQGPSDVNWYPFQLNPALAREGQPFDAYLTQRFGSPAKVEPVLQQLTAEGRAAGIDFRFDKLRHVPNTLAVHQLMYLAESRSVDQSALADDLMSALFEHGRDIGETSELIDIASGHGLAADDVVQAINSEKIKQNVLRREAQVRSSGIVGVPGFLLNRRLLIVGAQDKDTIIAAFDRAMFGEGSDSLGSTAPH